MIRCVCVCVCERSGVNQVGSATHSCLMGREKGKVVRSFIISIWQGSTFTHKDTEIHIHNYTTHTHTHTQTHTHHTHHTHTHARTHTQMYYTHINIADAYSI